jgi:primase-polymerase (primpol)-like protein
MKDALTVAAVQGVEEINANVICADVNTAETVVEPNWLRPKFNNIPDELKQQPWAVWIAEPRPGKPGKYNKAPRSTSTGERVGTDKPHLFGTLLEAKAVYERGGYTGVGVLLTGSGIIGVDIDDAVDTFKSKPEVKMWLSVAVKNGAYCEKSPSGSGLRLFMAGSLPGKGRKSGSLEIYDNVRFLTVTGHAVGLKKGGE